MAQAARRTRLTSAVRREQIIKEALSLISQQGYTGLSLLQVAQRCGLTNAGLLYYFPSKDALLFGVIEERERKYREFLIAKATDTSAGSDHAVIATDAVVGGGGIDRLLTLMTEVMRFESESRELVTLDAILRGEALRPDHPAHEHYAQQTVEAVTTFSRFLNGHVNDPAQTARRLFAFLVGLELQWVREQYRFDLVEAWQAGSAALVGSATTAG